MTEDNITEIIKALKPTHSSQAEAAKAFIGKKFGNLTVLDIPGRSIKRACLMAKCLCVCGNLTLVALSDVKRSHTKSCGCGLKVRRIIHGESRSAEKKASTEYSAWSRMRREAYKAKSQIETIELAFPRFVEKSIELICPRWTEKDKGYLNFLEDMGRKPLKSRLTKLDKTKRYDKENCYWKPNKGVTKNV